MEWHLKHDLALELDLGFTAFALSFVMYKVESTSPKLRESFAPSSDLNRQSYSYTFSQRKSWLLS